LNLQNLLKLYSTNQIIDSDTITVTLNNTTESTRLTLDSIDSTYYTIEDILTSNLYGVSGRYPYTVTVPKNKNFLVYVENNDTTQYTLPNSQKLQVILNRDLDYRQSCDILIDATTTPTQNKQLEVYVNYQFGSQFTIPVKTIFLETIRFTIYFNTTSNGLNSAKFWKDIRFEIRSN
jgi:hypothetical protein